MRVSLKFKLTLMKIKSIYYLLFRLSSQIEIRKQILKMLNMKTMEILSMKMKLKTMKI